MKKILSLVLLLSVGASTLKSVSFSLSTDEGFTLNDVAILSAAVASDVHKRGELGLDKLSAGRLAKIGGRYVVVKYGTDFADGYVQPVVDRVPVVNRLLGGEGNTLRRLLVALAVGEAANYTETGVADLTGYVRSKWSKPAQSETKPETKPE